MSKGYLLHIAASPSAESVSREVGRVWAGRLAGGALAIVERDLGREPLPYPDAAFAAGNLAGATEGPAVALSEALIAELDGCAMLVISTPMHNFTVPAALKSWIDYVVRPGRTFRGTPGGKVGLLADRPCFLVTSSGGTLAPEAGYQRDFLTPYLRYTLATIGLVSLRCLHLDRVARGEEARAAAVAGAVRGMG